MGIHHLKFTIVFMIAFTSLQNYVVRFFTDLVVRILFTCFRQHHRKTFLIISTL